MTPYSLVDVFSACQMNLLPVSSGRDSVVAIATRNGPDVSGILYGGYRVSSPGLKRPGSDLNHPTTSSAEIKERVELYLYSPSGLSWQVIGRNFTCIIRHVSVGWFNDAVLINIG